MPDSRRLLAPVDGKHALRGAAAALLAGAAALVFAAGLMTGWSLPHEPDALTDRCALPGGVDLAALGVPQRDRLARRAMMCADLEHGRITAAEYRDKVDALERPAAQAVEALPDSVWASSVLGFSSQYSSDSWSARPGARPAGRAAGGRRQPQRVGLDRGRQPHRVSRGRLRRPAPDERDRDRRVLQPGRRGQGRADPGRRQPRRRARRAGAPAAQAQLHRRIDFACTEQPVAGVRVTLDPAAVPDWNEIDAIGGRPCAE